LTTEEKKNYNINGLVNNKQMIIRLKKKPISCIQDAQGESLKINEKYS
jgi:hypothetical protein